MGIYIYIYIYIYLYIFIYVIHVICICFSLYIKNFLPSNFYLIFFDVSTPLIRE